MRKIAWSGTDRKVIKYQDGSEEIDFRAEARREIPFHYGTAPGWIKIVGPADGLSREYVFGKDGPQSFIQEMTDEDAAILLTGEDGEKFTDVTADPGFYERTYRDVNSLL